MKQTAASLCTLLLLCLCLAACRQAPCPALLLQADSLLRGRPDSAMALLRQAAPLMPQQPEATRMYYRLLCVKAADKAYVVHTSDSLIRPVIAYYEEHRDRRHLPEAYYYGGRVYRDLGDAPQALDYLQRAARLLEGSRDYSLKKVVYSQMGALFLFQDVYEEAMKAFKKSYQYQLLAHDKRGEVTTLCAIGYTFTALGNADSAMHYYRVAYEKALGYNDKKLVKRTLGDMASLYQQLKRYDLVEEILPELSNPKFFNRTVYYSILAEQYYNMGQKDSADYFYRKLLESDDPYTLQTAHWNLTSLAEERGDARTALKHLQQYKVWTDTIQKMTNFENIRKMQSLYNYQLREKENRELEEENVRQHLWMVYATAAVLLLIAFSLLQYQYNRRKRLRLAVQVEKLKLLERAQYERSKAYIEENERKIAALEKELQDSQTVNDELRKELLLTERDQIVAQNNKAKADRKEQELATVKFKQSEIYAKFHRAAYEHSVKIEEQDWELLREELDICYKNFTSRLNALVGPLSCINLRICLLIKAGIYMTGISLLVGREKSTIVSARKKLYKKMTGEDGKPEQWDKFIATF